jgi:hypothetical protein
VMKNPDLTAETRTGYYAHPPPAVPEADNKHANRPAFDLGLAVQSALPYDGIHLTVKRLGASDQFNVVIHAADISWTEGSPGKVLSNVMVIAEAFDRKGNAIGHSAKLSTLQDRENSSAGTPVDRDVNLLAAVPTNAPAAAIRIVIRDEATKKIGAINYPLDSPAGSAISN